MNPQKILFVFRKPNKGNFSIEKVYHCLFTELVSMKDKPFNFHKMTLKKNYDLVTFFTSFFSSLFSKRYVAHITGGCNYMVMAFPFKRRVLTVHDLFHFKEIKGIKGKLYDYLYDYLPIKFSHDVVVVSENTKNEILSHFSITRDKVIVLDNPLVIPSEEIDCKERIFSEDKMIKVLQIGDKPLKNYERLIEATKDLLIFYNFVHAKDERIRSIIESEAISEKAEVLSQLTDKELYGQYKNNDVLYFASEAEGFGLPILEAQAFGMPVITSDIPPMNDVGRGAILVDPFDVKSIRQGFLSLFDSALNTTNRNQAKQNVKKFSADVVASKYMEFYKSVV